MVRWVNDGSADHTVTSGFPGGPLASDVFDSGGSFEYTSEEQGEELAYFCKIHPFMTGSVVVGWSGRGTRPGAGAAHSRTGCGAYCAPPDAPDAEGKCCGRRRTQVPGRRAGC